MSTDAILAAFDRHYKAVTTEASWWQTIVHAVEAQKQGDNGPLSHICKLLAELSQVHAELLDVKADRDAELADRTVAQSQREAIGALHLPESDGAVMIPSAEFKSVPKRRGRPPKASHAP